MSTSLRQLIRELVEEELQETSDSSATPGYSTPFAFRGNSSDGKAKQKSNATQAGYEVVKGKTDDADDYGDPEELIVRFGAKGTGALKKPAKDKVVQEARYADFKMAEGHPRQKIGRAIREINRQISEIDKTIRLSSKLKKESGLQSEQMWKSTVRGLTALEGRLTTIATRIRELKA